MHRHLLVTDPELDHALARLDLDELAGPPGPRQAVPRPFPRYLVFTEVSREDSDRDAFYVNVLDLETGLRHRFVPEWKGEKVLLVSHALITERATNELGLR
ncbi:MAG: hypothetical protein BSOLF_0488 [Candidatus Carbobacillus altaicus]|uniref:Uncharacterized protein n=1 Tax=Candidatus Carbonibacillus altaicus TaxID=2163959 RepID=A0A2R6Y0U3_9BACL|nr:MAG: hypothetical protein BSOLF_0488 [Candidatus Carbobacillus altaicus]